MYTFIDIMEAADFSLPDQNGETHTLGQYRGKWVILYFYPKDDTPGCTKEACNFRDSIAEFKSLGVVILGVSGDSVASHKKFADKYNLNFTLLSDEGLQVIKDYNVWGEKKFLGKSFYGIQRTTYLIDPEGEIRNVYKKVNPLVHAGEILADLKKYSA